MPLKAIIHLPLKLVYHDAARMPESPDLAVSLLGCGCPGHPQLQGSDIMSEPWSKVTVVINDLIH